MQDPKYKIGATVFLPWAHAYTTKQIPCTICYGKKFVTIILGTGEWQSIECGACGRVGCDPASGTETVYVAGCGVHVGIITGMSVNNDEWTYEIDGGSRTKESDLGFIDLAHASAHAHDVLFPAVEAQAQRQFEENCLRHKRKMTWSAHYHRSNLARLRREAEYHEKMLLDPRCKESNPVGHRPLSKRTP